MKEVEAVPKIERRGAFTLKGIDPPLWRQVKAVAALEGLTVGAWVLKALEKQVRVDLSAALKKRGGERR